jgi:alkylation response protein AidB-like acyl-CoA dehydrogenase
VKLAWGSDEERFRTRLRAFLDEHAPAEGSDRSAWRMDEGAPQWARRWQATLFDHGWLVPGYPPELGGCNATPAQSLVYMEELAARGLPRSVHFPGYAIVGPSLLEFGTDEQQALAPAALRGDTVWCIGMSEPEAGSDLAALRTTAELDGDHFVVNGQKVWTSYAMWAQQALFYVRTNPDAPRHRGISVLIVPMDTPGLEIRPLRQITGEAEFAEVFLDDVIVPRANLLGELDQGWRVTMGSLAHERGGLWIQGVANLERTVARLVETARIRGLADDPAVRREIGRAHEEVASLRALGYKGFASFAQGSSAPEHSLLKIASSELTKRLMELGLRLGGPGAQLADRPDDAADWAHGFLTSLAGTIGGGTSEIQRNIVAERVLGLPRR